MLLSNELLTVFFNVVVFFFFAFWLGSSVPEDMRVLIQVALVVFGGGLVCLFLLYLLRSTFTRFVGQILGYVSQSFAEQVVGLLERFLDALGLMRDPRRLVLFCILTFLYWTINGVSTSMLASSYIPGISIVSGPFAISVVVFAIMIPAGPAFAGTMEAGFRLGLAPFGVAASKAAVVAVSAHVVQLVMLGLFVGLGFLAAPRMTLGKMAKIDTQDLET